MLLHHVYKTNVNEEEKLKKMVVSVISNQKQWPFKALGSFKEINCVNEYLLIDSIFIFVRTKKNNV